jgi:hypothetical protein
VDFVGAGLGENLDASVAEAVVLRGEGILVDANFADGGFGRKLSAGEAVDVDLAAVGTGRGTGESLEFVGELIGIVGERVEVCALDDDGAGVGVGAGADGGGVLGLDLDVLLLELNLERGIEIAHLAGGDRDVGHAVGGESLGGNGDAVGAGGRPRTM